MVVTPWMDVCVTRIVMVTSLYVAGLCEGDFFACRTSTRCLQPEYVCDGHNDCWDNVYGSDEEYCGKSFILMRSTVVIHLYL